MSTKRGLPKTPAPATREVMCYLRLNHASFWQAIWPPGLCANAVGMEGTFGPSCMGLSSHYKRILEHVLSKAQSTPSEEAAAFFGARGSPGFGGAESVGT